MSPNRAMAKSGISLLSYNKEHTLQMLRCLVLIEDDDGLSRELRK
jgi:hypothetical protein